MTILISQLILAFIFIIIGFIGGAVVVTLWFERQQNQDHPMSAPSLDILQPVGDIKEDDQQLLDVHLIKNLTTNETNIVVDGTVLSSGKNLSQKERQQLVELSAEWSAWLGINRVQAAKEPSTQPAGRILDERLEGAIKPVASQPLTPLIVGLEMIKVDPGLSTNPPVIDAKSPGYRPAITHSAEKSAQKKKTSGSSGTSSTIVNQINAILQEMIGQNAGSPEINLVETPSHGVSVWVGGKNFDGIDAIEDPEAKKMVKTAVAEWEKRNDLTPR
jgi:hypothetical protein